jgi:hypothetical protein
VDLSPESWGRFLNGRFFETGQSWLRQMAGFLSKLAQWRSDYPPLLVRAAS